MQEDLSGILDVRAKSLGAVVLHVVFITLFAIFVWTAIAHPSASNWIAAMIWFFAELLLLVWLKSFRILVRNDVLEYRSLLGGTKKN